MENKDNLSTVASDFQNNIDDVCSTRSNKNDNANLSTVSVNKPIDKDEIINIVNNAINNNKQEEEKQKKESFKFWQSVWVPSIAVIFGSIISPLLSYCSQPKLNIIEQQLADLNKNLTETKKLEQKNEQLLERVAKIEGKMEKQQ